MNKCILSLFLITLFTPHIFFSMEKEQHPYKSLNVAKKNSKYTIWNVSANENNNTAIVLKNNVSSIKIEVYDLLKKTKIHKFSSNKYIFLSDLNIKGDLIFLISDKTPKKPLWTYDVKNKKLKPLNYKVQPYDGEFTSAATNSKTSEYKAVALDNSRNSVDKVVLFDKDNNPTSDIIINGAEVVDLDISPSGKRLIITQESNNKTECRIMNIENKKKPVPIKTITTNPEGLCYFHRKYNFFCDSQNLYDKDGTIIMTLSNNPNEDVIGFNKKQFVIYNPQTKTVTLYKIKNFGTKNAQTKLITKLAWKQKNIPDDLGLAVSFIKFEKNNEICERIILYEVLGNADNKIHFYNINN